MCEFDFTISKHRVKEPITAHKVFAKLTKEWATFWAVAGGIPRGEWVRYNSKKIVNFGSPCPTFEDGFHCFVKPKGEVAFVHRDTGWKGTIPVQLKGNITVANQFGEEILVGEWIYVPTEEELEREERDYEALQEAA